MKMIGKVVWAERRFELWVGSEDRGGDLIKDDCGDNDDGFDDCGDNTSCNVSIINLENFMFPFSNRWGWSYGNVFQLNSNVLYNSVYYIHGMRPKKSCSYYFSCI